MDATSTGNVGKVFRFGDYRPLPERQLLLHHDRPVRLGSRAFDLLRLLVERPGELLAKAVLIRCAWPDTFVQEENLKVNIAALRRALAQPGSEGFCIATVTGRGYRFVAPVTWNPWPQRPKPCQALPRSSGAMTTSQPSPRRWPRGAS